MPKQYRTPRRRKGRIIAFQALYAMDTENFIPDKHGIKQILKELGLTPDIQEFTNNLVIGVLNNKNDLDVLLTSLGATPGQVWNIRRADPMIRNLLRLALYELLYTDVPIQVIGSEYRIITDDYTPREGTFLTLMLETAKRRKRLEETEFEL